MVCPEAASTAQCAVVADRLGRQRERQGSYSPLAQSLPSPERPARTRGSRCGNTAHGWRSVLRWADTPISVASSARQESLCATRGVVLRKGADPTTAGAADLGPQQAIELSRDYVASR